MLSKADYPNLITGNIALISRGTCNFDLKSSLAGKNGAVGVILFNNAPGDMDGISLDSSGVTEFGPVIPTVGTSGTDGNALAALIKTGSVVTAALDVKTVIATVST